MLAHEEEEKKEIGPFTTCLVFLAVIIFLIVTTGILSPAILVIRLCTDSCSDAYSVALNSFWAWAGCIGFWLAVGYSICNARDASYKESLKQVRLAGRQFTCFNCRGLVVEETHGLLNNGGVVCPFCKSVNVSRL